MADLQTQTLPESAAGLPPEAPLSMPKQVLEAPREGLLLLPVLRLFGMRAPRVGH